MRTQALAVVDMGASGGRMTLVKRQPDGSLAFSVVHEFSHPVHVLSQSNASGCVVRRYWNPGVIYENIVAGLRKIPTAEIELLSVGIDGWGSDGAWIDRDGGLLGLPAQGRDRRWIDAANEIEALISDRDRFHLTGVRNEPFCPINLLYWYARYNPELVDLAEMFLPMPALFNYWLCGERAIERSWIGTGQLADVAGGYCAPVFAELGLPRDKVPPIVATGTILGGLHRLLAEETGHVKCRVIIPAQHDTACAFAAARAASGAKSTSMIVSAGTWWLSGVAVPDAVNTDAAYDAVLTNVPGETGWILHHIGFGSWPAQELRRLWSIEDGEAMSWNAFNALVDQDTGAAPLIDTNDQRLLSPENMAAALCECAGVRSAERPRLARLVYDGLVATTGRIIDGLAAVTGGRIDEILMIGGGAKNDMLNQRLARSAGIPVRSALPNATTLGNAFVQARSLGWFAGIEDAARAVAVDDEKVFLP